MNTAQLAHTVATIIGAAIVLPIAVGLLVGTLRLAMGSGR